MKLKMDLLEDYVNTRRNDNEKKIIVFFPLNVYIIYNTFSLEQIVKTGDLNADLIMRHYKLDELA